jgi:hypothetical protein
LELEHCIAVVALVHEKSAKPHCCVFDPIRSSCIYVVKRIRGNGQSTASSKKRHCQSYQAASE